jgi:hypothetical protein
MLAAMESAVTRFAAAVLGATGLAACTADPDVTAAAGREAIFYGDPDEGHGSVVEIVALAQCSGALVAPTVVLTAHHCLAGSRGRDWTVLVGERPPLWDAARGREVVLPEDVDDRVAEDLALLVLAGDPGLPSYVPAADLGALAVGDEVTVVGYGLDERGDSGYRQRGAMTVAEIFPLSLTLVGDAYPYSGDSGGPIFDQRGQVIGVVSRGWDGGVIVGRVDAHRWFLDDVLRENRGCVQGDPERCDGLDNDCDGEVDPGCSALGGPCASSESCVEGECRDVHGDRICTEACDPRGSAGCWTGAYCAAVGCGDGEGLCRPGAAGRGAAGDACDDDLDCASLTCLEVGGRARCTTACRVDALECGLDETCAAIAGGCGACVPAAESAAGRGLGEPCAGDGGCRDGLDCVTDWPHRYCSRECDDGSGCPATMHCRESTGLCVRGPAGALGDPCAEDSDCASGPCWIAGEGLGACTDACRPGVTCPEGYSCDFDVRVCAPWDAVLGAPCGEAAGGAGCVVGECFVLEGEGLCSRPCDLACPSGFDCVDADGERWCRPVARPAASGCACAAAGASPGPERRDGPARFRRLLDVSP